MEPITCCEITHPEILDLVRLGKVAFGRKLPTYLVSDVLAIRISN